MMSCFSLLACLGVSSLVGNVVDGVQQSLLIAVRVQLELSTSVVTELSDGHLSEKSTKISLMNHRLYKRNGRNIRDVTHWFRIWAAPSLKFQVHAGKNKNTDSTYMGMRRGHGRSGGGCEGWISRTLVNQPVNHDVATP